MRLIAMRFIILRYIYKLQLGLYCKWFEARFTSKGKRIIHSPFLFILCRLFLQTCWLWWVQRLWTVNISLAKNRLRVMHLTSLIPLNRGFLLLFLFGLIVSVQHKPELWGKQWCEGQPVISCVQSWTKHCLANILKLSHKLLGILKTVKRVRGKHTILHPTCNPA